jgi:hypothetical protein
VTSLASFTRTASLGVLAAAALAACAGTGPAPSTMRVYHVDQQGGAQVCTVPRNVSLSPGGTTEAQMTVGNDGGWCGISVAQSGPKPYAAGKVVGRPSNGRLHVHSVGDRTRVDYYPDRGFSGSDNFTVSLVPGEALLRVAVTVQPGSASATATPAAAAPAPAAAAPRSSTPAAPAARSTPSTPASRSSGSSGSSSTRSR